MWEIYSLRSGTMEYWNIGILECCKAIHIKSCISKLNRLYIFQGKALV